MLKKLMIALCLLAISAPVWAERPGSFLYIPVDGEEGLLTQNDPAFRRIFDHTGNYLHHEGLRLYELDDHEPAPRTLVEATDLLERTSSRDVQAAIVVSVKQVFKNRGRNRLVATAHIVDAHSLQTLETVQVKSPLAKIRAQRCPQACREMVLRRHVREVLPVFRTKLVDRLERVRFARHEETPRHTRLTLTLKGFSPREVRHIEDRLVRLEGTRDLSALTSTPDKPVFWLERTPEAGDLEYQMSQLLADLDLQARIIQTRRSVVLEKVPHDLAYLD